jgi:branched-subunit amino acid transport system permease
MRFVGASREASRLSGVRVNRIRFGSFVAASALSGVGAVVAVAALGGYNPTTSDSYLLPVFAAVFLGTAIIEPAGSTRSARSSASTSWRPGSWASSCSACKPGCPRCSTAASWSSR